MISKAKNLNPLTSDEVRNYLEYLKYIENKIFIYLKNFL